MSKKILGLVLVGVLALGMIGCSNSKEENKANENTTKEEVSSKKDIPSGLDKEVGNGSVVLSTTGGTTENGNTPVVFVGQDTLLEQIGLSAENFDGSKLSYVYIDGMLNTKEQLGEMTQTTITLQDNSLKEGKHKVEVVQYDNDEQTGNPVTYKVATYEVKNK
ncbi:hypothetical protein J0A94_06200 [Paraclostridium bifermentans]|uniref:Lipoprotein n=1 Tax=Paraclostridium bifermentans TaxID=1490 RepID=A0AA44DM02_PARBF|nr:hypothetical protein [Paraclostridium bifermentans]MBN8047416.1 hypothetical protein [Paraclostridium bifermentans]NME09981.1 hypothetical protein [Paraclostridium bifermentans]